MPTFSDPVADMLASMTWPLAAKAWTGVATTLGVVTSLMAIGQATHVPCPWFGDELHLSTHDEWSAEGVHSLAVEVWGGKTCDGDDSVWIVGKDVSEEPWFPFGEANWDSDRGLYLLRIRDEQNPLPDMMTIHLVIAAADATRQLDNWPIDGDPTRGLDELPEGADDKGAEG